ncbi:uncharacterized methyltransferase YdaC [Thalassophryne amazonica]|uniref:uncharacterized methyltransferase YdaC n=1 Tax=Thalassophryne amazonica TaxID=390379 RepID=UPI0014715823|nr:uncharacterized methyltransferase YdaC [Thalassophryne amazonica]
MWAKKIGQHLAHPTRTVAGWFIIRFLKFHNTLLEEKAVELSRILPGDTVLEVGHGPGLGLQSAAKLLTGPTGHLIGVDYSLYMHQMASELMKDLVASGKVTLHHCSVTPMPIADNTVDKIFHCNCYYYWPDLKKGTTELHRVMKPGGLMVTTLRLSSVSFVASMGVLPGENWRPELYMAALTDSGFTDVRMENGRHKSTPFQVIYATASKTL